MTKLNGVGVAWQTLDLTSLHPNVRRDIVNAATQHIHGKLDAERVPQIKASVAGIVKASGRVHVPAGKRIAVKIILTSIQFAVVADERETKEVFSL